MHVSKVGHWPCLVLLALGASCGEEAEVPLRRRMFDLMDQATLDKGRLEDEELPAPSVARWSFDEELPEHWFARVAGRQLAWEESSAVHDPEGGRSGGSLRIGPGVPEDASRVALLLPATGFARVEVHARVRLEGSEEREAQSSREALRVVEHNTDVLDPANVKGQARRRTKTHRVARKIDSSGWDVITLEFVTEATTRCLEIDLLHRSRGSAEAVTHFDDIDVTVTPLGQAGLVAEIARASQPNDGHESETPWRVRVSLDGTVKDGVLLAAPASLTLPLAVPSAVHAPRLRFELGMPREARLAPGDGLRFEVLFRDQSGRETVLTEVELDPKNERDQRGWHEVLVDLTPVAEQFGRVEFHVADLPDSEPDPLDVLVLTNPFLEPAVGAPEPMNVLLIGVDTLRPDRMSAFGWKRDTTPNLKRLADEGIRFPRTRAQAPWTLPSFSSILTSLYPSQHGAGRGGHDEWTPIDPTTTSIAEVLQRHGYETAGLVANGLISPRYGLDQGFDSYRAQWAMESATRDAEQVVAFVEEHGETPWMMFWHIMDPHLPYETPKEVREQFTDADYDGQFADGRTPSVPFQVLDPRPGRRWFTHEGPPPKPDLTEEDVAFIEGSYEAELAEMDAAVGRVLDALEASGQKERTIVAFVADHGEGLDDHGHYHHGYTLFEDQVRIPWILRIPGRDAGRVVERSVAAIDLAPTLLSALGLPVPASFEGVDRLAPGAPDDDAYVLEIPTYDSSAQKGWVLGDYKYLHDPVFHTEALYDLASDPAESTNVLADHPDVVARARRELDAFRWTMLQKGRFHLRLACPPGARLVLSVTTDDLFDANFVARPAPPEEDFALDLGRKTLSLETDLDASGAIELVFWCRGTALTIEATLDGEPLELDVEGFGGKTADGVPIAINAIGVGEGSTIPQAALGRARLWLEAGVAPVEAVVNTPEEIERLQDLGYAR